MFHSTRIRLTAWYILIVAIVSVCFSAIIYREVTQQLETGFRAAELRLRNLPGIMIPRHDIAALLDDDLARAKRAVLIRLVILNGSVVTIAGAAGYFLAGKTLQPIEDMMDKQKRFIADASHELRTPLTAIKTETEVALRGRRLSGAQAKVLLTSNLEEVNKMQSLSDYLLALSKYEDPQLSLSFTKVHLKSVITGAVERVTPLAKSKQVNLVIDSPDLTMTGHQTSLTELVTILLDNAIKYSQPEQEVIVTSSQIGKQAKISIQDFGLGIKASDVPFIFNRFYRADSSRSKQRVDGYGLGLAIAKHIAELHQGKIQVSSTPGKGSTFTVILPVRA